MSNITTPQNNTSHSPSWRWWVSVLLLLATMINYMDRQTLANLAVRIKRQFELSQEQYGDLELVFGIAFAFGSLFFGVLADRVSIRILYPCVLVAWSVMGFLTGLTDGYRAMLICRAFLGFFESGHWPCALIVTQSIMSRGDRVMGNSVLQSGASIGAIFTPLIIRAMVGTDEFATDWRSPFLVIGGVGMLWAVLWISIVHKGDLTVVNRGNDRIDGEHALSWLVNLLVNPKFWAMAIMVICLNTSWQLIRAWLPSFLEEGRGYTLAEALYFNSAYYVATDVGCLLAGAAALWLASTGLDIHRARLSVFTVCAALTALTTVAASLPKGWPLLGVLLLVAAGSLGLFPCYYSFTQEMAPRHLGKATGVLAFLGWMCASPMQKIFGIVVDQTGSFDVGMMVVGWAPMVGLLAMLVLWRRSDRPQRE